jgi:hypothetical protein
MFDTGPGESSAASAPAPQAVINSGSGTSEPILNAASTSSPAQQAVINRGGGTPLLIAAGFTPAQLNYQYGYITLTGAQASS